MHSHCDVNVGRHLMAIISNITYVISVASLFLQFLVLNFFFSFKHLQKYNLICMYNIYCCMVGCEIKGVKCAFTLVIAHFKVD